MQLKAVSDTRLPLRASGILVHPTSFPTPYGVGDLGSGARTFIDFLQNAGQHIWQVLPLGPTGFGNSPYQSYSSFAGQPLLISPDELKKDGLLSEADLTDVPLPENPYTVSYDTVISYKRKLFKLAFSRMKDGYNEPLKQEFQNWCSQTEWLDDYALFMALKTFHNGRAWQEWEPELRTPIEAAKEKWRIHLADDIAYYCFLQFIFFRQWFALKKYANDRSICIIGDIPIFVASDSCDVWSNPSLFQLQEDGYPSCVAGVPPDYFSATGQRWGNPLYDWDALKAQGYLWWIKRVSNQLTLCDYLRIDHFRGFEAYWSVPFAEETAINGTWVKGPGEALFTAITNALGKDLPIIAEDLGVITPEVEKLRDDFHFPGMKVLQFAFDSTQENAFLPHYYPYNCICYSGTHDNDTTKGWYRTLSEESRQHLHAYLSGDTEDISWAFIRLAWASVAKFSIVPLQDVLRLDSCSRMNTPGTPSGNWTWRFKAEELTDTDAEKLLQLTRLYGRSL